MKAENLSAHAPNTGKNHGPSRSLGYCSFGSITKSKGRQLRYESRKRDDLVLEYSNTHLNYLVRFITAGYPPNPFLSAIVETSSSPCLRVGGYQGPFLQAVLSWWTKNLKALKEKVLRNERRIKNSALFTLCKKGIPAESRRGTNWKMERILHCTEEGDREGEDLLDDRKDREEKRRSPTEESKGNASPISVGRTSPNCNNKPTETELEVFSGHTTSALQVYTAPCIRSTIHIFFHLFN
ncbi:hypothetical protein EVAR_76437_1 [Eumeta japonica]|uniref:Uncharacterized protein n=1 Tax=Eumeta variegata TaxID=151549 RepID=A0A4C1TAM2_EUMVA|nr:hypothetical protein EVAR_76437_1 [Eumeta japonica]